MGLLSATNLTNESIKIGEFDTTQDFHFCSLSFLNKKDIAEQGRIVEYYLQNTKFLLLPRNAYESIGTDGNGEPRRDVFYTSLLLIWGQNIPKGLPAELAVEQSDMHKDLCRMIMEENSISPVSRLFLNNGQQTINLSNSSHMTSDMDGQYSYLITHRFIDGKYVYRITSTSAWKNHFSLLAQHDLDKNTVLDCVFTGRATNEYNNCYNFNKFKIKDFYIDEDRGRVILSNVKGILDLKRCAAVDNSVVLFNFLQDWNNPMINKPSYYSGMNIKIVDYIPEDLITVNQGAAIYRGRNLANRLNNKIETVLANDEELRYRIIESLFRKGASGALAEFLATKEDVNSIIERFDAARVEREKRDLAQRRTDLINSICQTKREIKSIEENILVAEYRIKNFIPMPEIKLPTKKTNQPVFDLMSILTYKDGKYYIEESESE